MDDKIRQGDLYTFYGMLLNGHQSSVYEDYVMNDLSLGEIAENNGVSRQGVHDLIRRCTKQMEEYESRMHLIRKFHLISQNVNRIETLLDQNSELSPGLKQEMKALSEEILEEI